MKTFIVTVLVREQVEIMAADADDALLMAQNTDSADFQVVDHTWSVEESEQ